jgi:hypothetical protein
VTRIGELGTTLAVTSNRSTLLSILVTLMMEAIRSCETSVRTRSILRHIPEEDILFKTMFLMFAAKCFFLHVIMLRGYVMSHADTPYAFMGYYDYSLSIWNYAAKKKISLKAFSVENLLVYSRAISFVTARLRNSAFRRSIPPPLSRFMYKLYKEMQTEVLCETLALTRHRHG